MFKSSIWLRHAWLRHATRCAIGSVDALEAVPIVWRIHSGITTAQGADNYALLNGCATLRERMAAMCVYGCAPSAALLATTGSYLVLDAYFAAGSL